MVGGDRVAQQSQGARSVDLLDMRRFAAQAYEEGWFLDVSGLLIPGIQIALPGGYGVPGLIAVEDVRIVFSIYFGAQGAGECLLDLLCAGPDLVQEYRSTLSVPAEGLLLQVDVHRARQG